MAPRVSEKDPSGRTVVLNGVRFSFADSLKDAKLPKKAEPGAKPTHSTNLILERDQKFFEANKAAVIEALKAACREFKKPEDWWRRLMEDDPKQIAFRKGERFKTDSGEVYKGYENNLIIVAKGPSGGSKRPKIKDRHKRDVEVADINDVVYNGTYGDAIVSFYGTDKGGTPRLTCSIEAARSYQEGERMGGGGVYVEDSDFDDMDDDGDSFSPSGQKSSGDVLDL